MDSQTKYRILGILVIVGVLAIVLPFVHFRKGNKTETLLNPPAFPQATSVAENQPVLAQNEAPALPLAEPNQPEIISENNNLPVEEPPSAIPEQTAMNTAALEPQVQGTNLEPPQPHLVPVPKTAPKTKHLIKHTAKLHQGKHKIITAQHRPKHSLSFRKTYMTIHDNGLYDVQKPVWVIQLGSYQSKETAIRMVNSLRASGYKAFFQEMDTVLGQKTKVFVGPELEQNAARQMVKQLQAELKLRGVVVSYKPFSL